MMYSWFIDIDDMRAETRVVAFTYKWLDNDVDDVMLVMIKNNNEGEPKRGQAKDAAGALTWIEYGWFDVP